MTEILFVCTANQFRSPIAAAYFARKLTESGRSAGWTVSSAGTWARADVPAHPAAVKAATKFGLDLSAHRSREVNPSILSAAHLIVVMDHGHKEALESEFSQCKGRIVLLAEVAGNHGDEIDDPALTNFESADAAVQQITTCIDAGFEKLVDLAETRQNDPSTR